MSLRARYTVLDVEYRVAPENPFPAAIHDAEDVVKWVIERPSQFDLSKVALSGFSAGGNIALGLSSVPFPPKTFHSVIAFYPVVDSVTDPGAKIAPDPAAQLLPSFLLRIFKYAVIQPPTDARDPRLSPLYTDPRAFPDRVLIVTAAHDNLAIEAENLAYKIAMHSDRHVVCYRAPNCKHAWDKFLFNGITQAKAKGEAYTLAADILKL
ncbi:hypothetical protein BBP40_002791 [Aspergillus hancockii]|nr:hypothetical protein BBP40_002791 [Aspergillus hancockii]